MRTRPAGTAGTSEHARVAHELKALPASTFVALTGGLGIAAAAGRSRLRRRA